MHPFHTLNQILDRLTMYRVVLYALASMVVASFVLTAFSVLPHALPALFLSLVTSVATAYITHTLLQKLTGAPANLESSLITALILFLILTPPENGLEFAAIIAGNALAIVLKYVVVYRKRHLFNPAALALVIIGVAGIMAGYFGATWWVGSRYLLPIVLLATLAVVIKTRRFELFFFYIAISSAVVVLSSLGVEAPLDALSRHFLSWPTIFFAGIMLTEPLGLPSTKRLQYIFAAIVAVASSIPFHIGMLYGTPELALLLGNVFTFLVDRPGRLLLTYRGRTEVGVNAYEYRFTPSYPLTYTPGQYLEWTLPHKNVDSRGIRRYFTIVSAPQASEISFAVRHIEKQSSFKEALATLAPDTTLFATQKAGDFTLNKNAPHHVWIAGGIGITPFMSMLRSVAASETTLSVTLFNCNKSADDRIFGDELAAAPTLGVSVVDILSVAPDTTSPLTFETGFLTAEILKKHVKEWEEATYYISGPPPMVNAYVALLKKMKVPQRRIITDYFPGLA